MGIEIGIDLSACRVEDSTEEKFVGTLRALKKHSGKSVRQLSRATGVPASTLGGYFTGRHLPRTDPSWERLLEELGVDDLDWRRRWTASAQLLARRRRAGDE